jgi:hypothetical protein
VRGAPHQESLGPARGPGADAREQVLGRASIHRREHPAGTNPGRIGRARRLDGGHDQLVADQPDIEPDIPGRAGRARLGIERVGELLRDQREVRLPQPLQHVPDHVAQRLGARGGGRLGTELLAKRRPVDAVEGRVEMRFVDDPPGGIERLEPDHRVVRPLGRRRRRAGNAAEHGEQQDGHVSGSHGSSPPGSARRITGPGPGSKSPCPRGRRRRARDAAVCPCPWPDAIVHA